MSAQSQLMGLYPSGTGQNLRESSLSDIAVPPISVQNLSALKQQLGNNALLNQAQVIPIYTNKQEYQTELAASGSNCPRIGQLEKKNFDSKYMQDLFQQYSDTVNVIKDYFNTSFEEASEKVMEVNDSIGANIFQGNSIPEEFTQDFVYRLTQLARLVENYMRYSSDELIKLYSSLLLQDISDQLNYAAKGLMNNKFMLLSAHDTTLQPVLYSLKATQWYSWPIYASTIFFKLYKDQNGAYYVKTIYNDRDLILPTCNVAKCPLDTFTRFISTRVLSSDFAKACQVQAIYIENDQLTYEQFGNIYQWYYILPNIIFAIVLIIFGTAVWLLFRKKPLLIGSNEFSFIPSEVVQPQQKI